ncbi:RGP1 retrograde golgi transport protein, putative [Acanthamoeba castellanii str. Neff]|uniref:RGP1 retrograde golgi transport protein, putative n=1 Tax=Acanthamoeba castellanii (strain ATCC 30010 / Neff) TaxID=1257118 RepID=L8GH43_ACACF|nr:RGP1 retrograde golgi transport protein, putative [Acanthamoeba castellanii str. Neff]ELR12415.1 RGP1 retrograde golgi transport protein, putative [Acanthamoeba castellanii str. Neff]
MSPSKPTSLQRTVPTDPGGNTRLLFTSGPHIFACDVTLAPDQSRTYGVERAHVVYRAFLPTDIPSSFSGKYIKVAYWLTVCGQQPLHETVSLRVPLRVVNPLVFKRLGLMEWRSEDRAGVEAESQEVEPVDLSRAFHFVHNHTLPERGDSSFENEPRRTTEPSAFYETSPGVQRRTKMTEERAMRLQSRKAGQQLLKLGVQAVSAHVAHSIVPESFTIAKGEQLVGKVNLAKRTFQLGEAIKLALDFESARIPCYQYTVSLQSVEQIEEAARKDSGSELGQPHSECTMGAAATAQCVLSIPPQETAEFQTDVVSHSWYLHFDFVTGFETKERAKGEGEAGAPRSSTGPTRRVHDLRFFGAAGELQVDTLRWDIPIHVVAVGPVARASLHPPIHRLKFAAS